MLSVLAWGSVPAVWGLLIGIVLLTLATWTGRDFGQALPIVSGIAGLWSLAAMWQMMRRSKLRTGEPLHSSLAQFGIALLLSLTIRIFSRSPLTFPAAR